MTLLCFTVFLIPLASSPDSLHALTASYGQPYHGRLINGIPFPPQFQGYQLRDEDRVFTTPEVIGALLDAFETVRSQYPNTCDLYLGDFSMPNGGPANHHRSHQNGRDVDMGMYAKGNRRLDGLVLMTEENFDAAKNWTLIEGLLRSQRVQYIFVDRRLQRLLYDYAVSQGVDEAYLDRLFGSIGRGGVIQHIGNHQDHLHVRFFTPWSTLAAHVSEMEEQKRAVIEMAQQSYLPKKVHYYATGKERNIESLAKSFGVCGRDLCRWNNFRPTEMLNPGSCVVFYKRGFELEPVHLAQSLQPVPLLTASSPIRVASLPPSQSSVSDVTTTLRDNGSREKRVEAPPVSSCTVKRSDATDKAARRNAGKSAVPPVAAPDPRKAQVPTPCLYKVEKGDTLTKIAKQTGMKLEVLCELNGVSRNAAVKPGQTLQLVMNEPASRTDAMAGPHPAHSAGRTDQTAWAGKGTQVAKTNLTGTATPAGSTSKVPPPPVSVASSASKPQTASKPDPKAGAATKAAAKGKAPEPAQTSQKSAPKGKDSKSPQAPSPGKAQTKDKVSKPTSK